MTLEKKEKKQQKPKSQKVIEKQIAKSFEQIDEIMRQASAKGFSLKDVERNDDGKIVHINFGLEDGQKRNETKTPKRSYRNHMRYFVRKYAEKFGEGRLHMMKPEKIDEIINDEIREYFNGRLGRSYTIQGRISAAEYFQEAVKHTKVLKKPIEIINGDKKRKQLKQLNVIRYINGTSRKKLTTDEAWKIIDNIKNGGYDVQNRQTTAKIAEFCLRTGSRITAAFRLETKHIDFKKKTLTFYDDKNRKTRTIELTKEDIRFLRSVIKEAKGDTIFQLYKKNGAPLSRKKSIDVVGGIVSEAGLEFQEVKEFRMKDENGIKKTVEIIQNATTHGFRKAAIYKKTYDYLHRIKDNEWDKIMEELKRVENPKTIDAKYKKAVKEKNWYHGDNRSRWVDLTDAEKSLFAASVFSGHYRNSVVGHYVDRKEITRYSKHLDKMARIENQKKSA